MFLHQPPDSASIAEATANAYANRTKRRVRTKFNKYQLDILEATFDKTHYPDVSIVDRLADVLGLGTERISIWFQNRRARFKKYKSNQHNRIYNTQWCNESFESTESLAESQTPMPRKIYDLKFPILDANGDSSISSFNYNTTPYHQNQHQSQYQQQHNDANEDDDDDDHDSQLESQHHLQFEIKKENLIKSEYVDTFQNNSLSSLQSAQLLCKTSSNYSISSLHNFQDDQSSSSSSSSTTYTPYQAAQQQGHYYFQNYYQTPTSPFSLPLPPTVHTTPYTTYAQYPTCMLTPQQQYQEQAYYYTNYMPPTPPICTGSSVPKTTTTTTTATGNNQHQSFYGVAPHDSITPSQSFQSTLQYSYDNISPGEYDSNSNSSLPSASSEHATTNTVEYYTIRTTPPESNLIQPKSPNYSEEDNDNDNDDDEDYDEANEEDS